MTDMSGGVGRTAKVLISVVVIAVAAVAVVWFVVARRSGTDRTRTETSADAAVDGFVRAYNDGDEPELESRVCRGRASLVVATLRQNRRTISSVRRDGPVQRSSGANGDVAVVQLAGTGPGGSVPAVLSVARADAGRWCVTSMGGVARVLPVRPSR